jgi:hypothetical protein
MTKSIKSEDGTHYNCAECGIIKWINKPKTNLI